MKKIHKIALVLAVILAIVTGLTYTTFAVTGKITVETIRLRLKPTTESKIVGMGDMGDSIEILGEEEGWYKVRYKGIEGYAYKDYIQTSEQVPQTTPTTEEPVASESPAVSETPQETPVEEPSPEVTPEPTPDESQEVSNPNPVTTELGDTLNKDTSAYLLPNYTSVKIAELKQNEQVKIVTTLANWAKVESNNKESWIPKTLLMKEVTQQPTEQTSAPEATQEQVLNEATYISSTTSVNLRQGPSTETQSLAKLTTNTKITIISEENDWYKVTFNGQEGYVAKRLVTKGEPPATEEVSSRSATSRATQVETAPVEPPTPATPASAAATSAASIAQNYVGCSYVYGGNSPEGFDCSGFTSYCYAQAGISLGRTTYAQASQGTAVSKSELQPGDLIVFRGTSHVGIYVGNGQFIHASNPETGVVYDTINYGYWANQYQSARRF